MRFKATARYGLPIFLVGLLILFTASAIFFYRGQCVLLNLIAHGQGIPSTTVYSRWWSLSAGSGLTWPESVEALHSLDYVKIAGEPEKVGQFHAAYPVLSIYLHEFTYPDGHFPSQRITLHFDRQRLVRVEASASPLATGDWRLEPKTLAQWSANDTSLRKQIFLDDIPAYIPQAIVAIEDKRFYKHGAFDVLGVLRAFIIDIRQGRVSQGASTLSQQLARSIFLSSHRTVSRKLLEAVLALYLELRFSKRQLLEMYMNQVYWGQEGSVSLLGVDAASHSYFNKAPRDLTLAEAAMLAGLLQSPNHYSPRNAPDIARERRNLVLKLMHDQGLISNAMYHQAHGQDLHITALGEQVNECAYFLATLQDTLEEHYPGAPLPTAGWSIYTTLDPLLEHQAVVALQHTPRSKSKSLNPEAALVAIDPQTGAVRAWVGGTDYHRAPFDRALYAHRQPGSAFKPFVMLAALDKRVATTATLIKDEPLTVPTAHGPWSPQNFDRRYRHQVSLWDSLVQSLNVPTVMLAMRTGLPSIAEYAHRAGIQSPISIYPAMALGASEVTPLELTNAYATLASGGIYEPSYTVEAIMDAQGQTLEAHRSAAVQVFNPLSVALVTRMLQAVLTEGTGAAARSMGLTYPAAGKTGTSENFQDAWFMGYQPRLTCGVWVGYDQPRSLGRAAAGIALPVWVAFMQKAIPLVGEDSFQKPPGLVTKTIDPETMLLARSGCPIRRDVAFLPGTEPTQRCMVHAGGIVGFFHRLLNSKSPQPKPMH